MADVSKIAMKHFSNTTRLGHILVYNLLQKECQELYKKLIEDYKISGAKKIELDYIIQSYSYIQLETPSSLDENSKAEAEHIERKIEYKKTLSHSS